MGFIVDRIVLLCTSAGSPESYDVWGCINESRVHVRLGYIVFRDNYFKVCAFKPGTADDTLVLSEWYPSVGQFGNEGLRNVGLEKAERAIKNFIETL